MLGTKVSEELVVVCASLNAETRIATNAVAETKGLHARLSAAQETFTKARMAATEEVSASR